eukprot:scaffold11110_cov101-Isochrysis_galbana.AAC.2
MWYVRTRAATVACCWGPARSCYVSTHPLAPRLREPLCRSPSPVRLKIRLDQLARRHEAEPAAG